MFKSNEKCYYVGVNLKDLVNMEVTVLDQDGWCGTKNDCPVYKISDENGVVYRVAGCNLDTKPHLNRKTVYWGLQDCFPSNVLRFDSFEHRGKYIGDLQ